MPYWRNDNRRVFLKSQNQIGLSIESGENTFVLSRALDVEISESI